MMHARYLYTVISNPITVTVAMPITEGPSVPVTNLCFSHSVYKISQNNRTPGSYADVILSSEPQPAAGPPLTSL